MIRIIPVLGALAVLTACTTVDRRLPWTAGNLRTVGEKCGVPGIETDTRIIVLSGLFTLGKTPPWKIQEACLKRNIQVPAGVMFMTT